MTKPMLAKLVRELPVGDYLYEPKWDGFRCLAARDGDAVELRSRNGRPLERYFPELVEALRTLRATRFVVDGEIVTDFDFTALLSRLHPAASRVDRLSRESPADLIVFDALSVADDDLTALPFVERRHRLEELLTGAPASLRVTEITDDAAVARRWLEARAAGIDGVVAKHRDLRYQPGKRSMLKVKHVRAADCVVGGFRVFVDRPLPSSLLLGLYDDAGTLQHVGIASGFSETRRHELLDVLRPHVARLAGHPWERGFLLAGSPMGRLPGAAARWSPDEMTHDWVPVAPVLVCEVAYDHVDALRFRHPARFRRWRPDRDPESCRLEQLERA